jgi:hypothetical protein
VIKDVPRAHDLFGVELQGLLGEEALQLADHGSRACASQVEACSRLGRLLPINRLAGVSHPWAAVKLAELAL